MIKIKVIKGNKQYIVNGHLGEILFDVLINNNFLFKGNCGKNGKCGHCSVIIIGDNIGVSSEDIAFFTDDEIAKGYRLACKYVITSSITVIMNQKKSFEEILLSQRDNQGSFEKKDEIKVGLAIDIGTTTIGMSLVDLQNKSIIDEYGIINSQGKFGSDVMSRIKYASTREGMICLNRLIKEDIKKGVEYFQKKEILDNNSLVKIIITGNSTMLYILKNLSPEKLGTYPFTLEFGQCKEYEYKEIMGDDSFKDTLIEILPCSSAFVGADVLAGVVDLDMDIAEDNNLLIDLGTNGEMVIGNCNKLISTSTAAGPSFEGAFRLMGVSGTALIDSIARCYRGGLINKEGLIIERFFEKGIVLQGGARLTQDTIRQIQLAKSAIVTGVKILVKKINIEYSDITNVYISGGFGFNLKIENAFLLNLLPKQLKDKVIISGNTSLKGAVKGCSDGNFINRTKAVCGKVSNIDLANEPEFNDLFLENLSFN